jgi:hypothetical protein
MDTCAGSISEEGFVNNLLKKGFTDFQSICELISNSIDAQATDITFYVKDNGTGLDIRNMFNIYNSNHKSSMGIGGK